MAHSNMRPLIQYDLDEPPTVPSPTVVPPPHPSNTHRPQTKKRKRNHRNQQKHQPAYPQKTPLQHWDDPGSTAIGVVYDEQEGSAVPSLSESVQGSAYVDDVEEEKEDYGEEWGFEEEEGEESRPLTREEIWDDAALIDAWNSAEAEYEAYHGTSKAWKTEPVKRSPLWYNKPYTAPSRPDPSKPNARSNNIPPASLLEREDGESEPDSVPLDFDTYVPTHDPSLAIPSDGTTVNPPTTPFSVPPPSTMMVNRDEAFNNALSAMYWSGYWTAVYHCQSRGQNSSVLAEASEENGIEADEDEDEAEDLVPTQR